MKMHRLPYHQQEAYILRQQNRERAEYEAMRLIQNKNDMFEKYLKKPQTTSVGFLALEKLNSQSSRHQPKGKVCGNCYNQRDARSTKSILSRAKQSPTHKIARGGGVVSDNRRSPIQSSNNDDRVTVDVESLGMGVSMLQTTFEVDENARDNKLRR